MDVDQITAVLHRHGALALWDYATAAPHVNIDMNPVVTGWVKLNVYNGEIQFSHFLRHLKKKMRYFS